MFDVFICANVSSNRNSKLINAPMTFLKTKYGFLRGHSQIKNAPPNLEVKIHFWRIQLRPTFFQISIVKPKFCVVYWQFYQNSIVLNLKSIRPSNSPIPFPPPLPLPSPPKKKSDQRLERSFRFASRFIKVRFINVARCSQRCSQNSQENTCAGVPPLIWLEPATVLKKRLQRKWFLVKFAKISRH